MLAQNIDDVVPTDQHVCADTIIKYTLFGFTESTVKWYIDDVHLTDEDVLIPNDGANISYIGYTYNKAILNYTWTLSGANTLEVHSLKIQEISANPAACGTGILEPGLKVHVHAQPEIPIAIINPILCNGQVGSIIASVSATAPTDLVTQVRLVDGSVNAISGQDWVDISGTTHKFDNLSEGNYKILLRYTYNGDHVRGSIVSSDQATLTNPTVLTLSNSVTKLTCTNDDSGAVDLTVTGGYDNSLNFNGTSGGVQINSWSPLYNTSEFTVEGWVKLKSGSSYTSGQYSFFGQNNTVEFGIDGGNLHGWVKTRNGYLYTVNYPIAGNLDDDQFHHLAFTGNRSNLILYVDGVAVQNLSVSISVGDYFGGSTGGYLRIGTGVFDGGTNDPFDGEISKVRFWSIARTQTQILSGMSELMIGSESGLIGAYPLNEGSGTTISGVGNFANDGNIASGVSWKTDASLYSYSWTKQGDASFTATTQDISDLSSGTYLVTVINTNGCSISDNNIVVGVKPDNTDPVITNMPTDILVTNCSQVVNWVEPTATDNCGTPTLTSNYSSGKAFPTGETIVTYTANDGTNSVQESFKITVQDGGRVPLICFESTNYAIGKTAIQSSTYPNGTASKAVDGNTNGVWANNSVTHTNNDMNAWWQVDLGAEEAVDYVNVFRRTDCCTDRLVNFYVMLSNNDLQSVTLADALIDPNVESYYVEGNPGNLKRILTSGNSARYVKIQLSARNHLSLAEVEVMGCSSQNRKDISENADNGKCTAQVFWDEPTSIDNCGTVSLSSNYNSGDDFPIGTTTVIYTSTDGANVATSSFDVIVTDDQDPIITNCPTNIIVGSCATVTWTDPTATDNCSVTLIGTHKSGDVFPVGKTTTVTYTATDGASNTATCSFDVTVEAAPTAAAGSDVTIGSCGASTTTLNGSGTGNTLTYSWSPSTGLSDASILNPVANPVSTTTYTLTVEDKYGCTATDQVTVTVLPDLTISLSETASALCNGDNAQVTITAGGGDGSYTYSNDGTNYQASSVFSLPAGTHTLYVKDGNACVAQKNITINQPIALNISIDANNNTICEGDIVEVTGICSGGTSAYTYEFYLNGSTTPLANGADYNISANKLTSSVFANGDKITVKVIDANFCEKVSNEVVVTVYALPTPTIFGDFEVCAEDPETPLDPDLINTDIYTTEAGMSNYTWTVTGGTIELGVGTNEITVKWKTAGTGTLSVNYENSNGCIAVSAKSETITIYKRPNPSSITSDN